MVWLRWNWKQHWDLKNSLKFVFWSNLENVAKDEIKVYAKNDVTCVNDATAVNGVNVKYVVNVENIVIVKNVAKIENYVNVELNVFQRLTSKLGS